jgi:hypothetical protein
MSAYYCVPASWWVDNFEFVSWQFWIVSWQFWIVSWQFWIVNCELTILNCELIIWTSVLSLELRFWLWFRYSILCVYWHLWATVLYILFIIFFRRFSSDIQHPIAINSENYSIRREPKNIINRINNLCGGERYCYVVCYFRLLTICNILTILCIHYNVEPFPALCTVLSIVYRFMGFQYCPLLYGR